jgi:hypothetical protein
MRLAFVAAVMVVAPAFVGAESLPSCVSTPNRWSKAEMLEQIDAWRKLEVPDGDPAAERFGPELDRLQQEITSADDGNLTAVRKDFHDWKVRMLLTKYKSPTRSRRVGIDFCTYVNRENEKAEAVMAISRAVQNQVVAEQLTGSTASMFAQSASPFDNGGTFPALDGGPTGAVPGARSASSGAGGDPRTRALQRTGPVPAPSGSSSSGAWSDYLDVGRASALGHTAMSRCVGFIGKCYHYVAGDMESSGVMPRLWPAGIEPGHAYEFAVGLKAHPYLITDMHLARISPTTNPLPIGTIINYQRGCIGFSAKSGHIEVVSKSPAPYEGRQADAVYACSDGCTWRRYSSIDAAAAQGCVDLFIPSRKTPANPLQILSI